MTIENDLITIEDYVRWGVTQMVAGDLHFGHGTDNALDESVNLALYALQLSPNLLDEFRHARLTQAERSKIVQLIEKRVSTRMPAAYLTGSSWFAGLEFVVDSRVLVPRSPLAETIEHGFEPWVDSTKVSRILDLCTGSGCIAIACAHYFDQATIDAVDVSVDALEVAKINAKKHDVTHRVHFIESDLFQRLPQVKYDVVVSNPPYVSQIEYQTLPKEYLHEPSLALLANDEGIAIVKRILYDVGPYLSPSGIVVVEVGSAQEALESAFPNVPFTWLEFERGGEGVFVLSAEDIHRYFQSP